MRLTVVYVIVTLMFTTFAVLLFVQHVGQGMEKYSMMTKDRFNAQNAPNTPANIDIIKAPIIAANIDINGFISLQPHYKKLCELDR